MNLEADLRTFEMDLIKESEENYSNNMHVIKESETE